MFLTLQHPMLCHSSLFPLHGLLSDFMSFPVKDLYLFHYLSSSQGEKFNRKLLHLLKNSQAQKRAQAAAARGGDRFLFLLKPSVFSLSAQGISGEVRMQRAAWDISHVVRAPAGAHICLQLSASRSHQFSRRANQTYAVISLK